jgi:hypothetical protein
MKITLMDVLGEKYPAVKAYALGDGDSYSAIVHDGGDTMPSEATLLADLLEFKRKAAWQAIQDERTRRQNGGVYISSAGKWFHSDQTSRIQQLGLVMMGANLPSNINWKTMDGSFIIMTPTIAAAIFNAAATLDMMSFAVAEQHRVAMNQVADPTLYDFSGSWPAIYA